MGFIHNKKNTSTLLATNFVAWFIRCRLDYEEYISAVAYRVVVYGSSRDSEHYQMANEKQVTSFCWSQPMVWPKEISENLCGKHTIGGRSTWNRARNWGVVPSLPAKAIFYLCLHIYFQTFIGHLATHGIVPEL